VALLLSATSAWAAPRTWTGATSTAWANPSNWAGGVPGAADQAIIPAGAGLMPIISANATVNQLQVFGTLTISAGTLTVVGTTSPAIDGTGTVTGAGLLSVTTGVNNGILINDTITLGNFTLSSTVGFNMGIPSGKTVTVVGALLINTSEIQLGTAAGAAATLDVKGSLTINANGSLIMRSSNNFVRVSGNWTQAGRFTSGTGSTVILDGAAAQTLTVTSATLANVQFENLQNSNTGGVVTYAPNGNLATGFVVLGNFTLDANTNTIIQEPAIIGNAVGDTLGIGSGATLTFTQNFDPDCTIAFDIDAGAQDGTLVLQGATLPPADTSDFGFALRAGKGTVRIEVSQNGTFNVTNGGPYSFYNLVMNTTSNVANQVDAQVIVLSGATVVQNTLSLTRVQLQIGSFTLSVKDVASGLSTQSQLDFTAAPGVLRATGNVDLGSVSQVAAGTAGPFATILMAGTTPQTFQVHAATASSYHDLDSFQVSNPAGVTVLDNPNADFVVNGTLTIDANCSLTVQDVFNADGPVVFRAGGGNVLRLQNLVNPDATPMGTTFTPGTGTVIYGSSTVNQIVYGRTNGAAFSYYNLTIDNPGRVATQEAAALTVNGSFTIQNVASTFTATNNGMTVSQNFTANGAFNNGAGTVTMNGTGTIGGTSASLVFNNLAVNGLTSSVVTAARSFTTSNTFQVIQGTLATAGVLPAITMTASIGMTVGNGAGAAGTGIFSLVGPDVLAITSPQTFSVNATDGRFTSLANANGTPTLTHSGLGTFTATVNGQANLYGLNFSFGDANGLNFSATSTIERLRNVRFTNINAAAGAHHLTITSPGIDLDCPGCFFDTVAANQFNVWAVDSAPGGTPVRLRFEFRTAANTPTAIGGPGGGETWDGDDDTNDDGVIAAPETTVVHGGAIVQWLYTINIDMPLAAGDAIQGFPLPAFDWNTFAYYSTYAVMRSAAGSDLLYVLDQNGDIKSFWPPAPIAGMGHIAAPPFFDTEAGVLHVLYLGTDTGQVYKLVDTSGTLALPAAAPWNTVFTDARLTKVSSFILSDQVNLYFGGVNNAATDALFKIQINPRTMPNTPIASLNQPVTQYPSWSDTTTGRRLYIASNPAAGASNVYRVATSTWTIEATLAGAAPFGATSLPNSVLFVGDAGGFMNGLPATGTPAQFTTQQAGFPFRDAAGVGTIVKTAPGWDSSNTRLIYGNSAGNLYTMNINQYAGTWTLNTNYFMYSTGSAVALNSIPLALDGVIYASNAQGTLYAIDAFRGALAPKQLLIRQYNLGSPALSDLARDADLASGRIYVTTGNGKLYALTPLADPTPLSP
jgi:hypothetical protein